MGAVLELNSDSNLDVQWPTQEDLLLIIERNEARRNYFLCKRIFDFIAAAALLIFLSPFMLLISILIMIETPGPAIFKQDRVGLRRKGFGRSATWQMQTFTMYKFRSMYHDADENVHREFTRALIQNDEKTVDQLLNGETQLKKLTKDNRITRVGKVIRKTSLDELPQLINVFVGDMGLVGPRPPTIYEAQMYNRWQGQRMGTVPGMTGLWQVKGRSCESYEGMIKLDLEYIEQQSFLLDLKILALTPLQVISTKGAA